MIAELLVSICEVDVVVRVRGVKTASASINPSNRCPLMRGGAKRRGEEEEERRDNERREGGHTTANKFRVRLKFRHEETSESRVQMEVSMHSRRLILINDP